MKLVLKGEDFVCECAINPMDGQCWSTDRAPFLRWTVHDIKHYAKKRGWKVEEVNNTWGL